MSDVGAALGDGSGPSLRDPNQTLFGPNNFRLSAVNPLLANGGDRLDWTAIGALAAKDAGAAAPGHQHAKAGHLGA